MRRGHAQRFRRRCTDENIVKAWYLKSGEKTLSTIPNVEHVRIVRRVIKCKRRHRSEARFAALEEQCRIRPSRPQHQQTNPA